MNIYGYYYSTDNGSDVVICFPFMYLSDRQTLRFMLIYVSPKYSPLIIKAIKRSFNRKSRAIKTAMKSQSIGDLIIFWWFFFPFSLPITAFGERKLSQTFLPRCRRDIGSGEGEKKCAEIIINLLVCHLWPEFIIESLRFRWFLSGLPRWNLWPFTLPCSCAKSS